MGLDYYVALFDIAQYRQRVEPALKKYFETGECIDILLLLQEAKTLSGSDLPESVSLACSELIQSSINILNGIEFYGPSVNHVPPSPDSKTSREDLDIYVRGSVGPQLLERLCIPRKDGGPWEQNMGRSVLVRYLYEHSSWIEGAFTAGGISD